FLFTTPEAVPKSSFLLPKITLNGYFKPIFLYIRDSEGSLILLDRDRICPLFLLSAQFYQHFKNVIIPILTLVGKFFRFFENKILIYFFIKIVNKILLI